MDNSLYTAKTLVKERAGILPNEITSLITGGALSVTIYNAQNEFHLTDTQSTLLENEVTLVLLFFLDLKGFAERIAESLEVEPLTASKIASFIHDDLFYEINDIFELVYNQNEKISEKIKEEELTDLRQIFTPIITSGQTVDDTSVPQSGAVMAEEDTIEIQEPHTPVQPMRTMEGDMSRIHGYGAYRAQFPDEPKEAEHTQEVIRSASQEDLLKEKPKLAEMPTYEENE
jgi:hypothetical protein